MLARDDNAVCVPRDKILNATEHLNAKSIFFIQKYIEQVRNAEPLYPLLPRVIPNHFEENLLPENTRRYKRGNANAHRILRKYNVRPAREVKRPPKINRVPDAFREFSRNCDKTKRSLGHGRTIIGKKRNSVPPPRKPLGESFTVCCGPPDLGRVDTCCDTDFYPIRNIPDKELRFK